ncbi:MAG TPA: ABC transporter permease [Acidimicrobiales bacterium]|nr:ABC transporter permease [Acidimicrobiales bacterium]
MTNQAPERVDPVANHDLEPMSLRSNTTRLLSSWRTAGIAIPFLILFVTLSISSQPFLHTTNLINILDQQAATLCIAAAGTLVLVAGGIDLSVGATYGLATVVAGEIAAHHSPVLAIVAAIGTGLLVGLINGLIVTVFKINALITTLAMSFVIGGLALKVSGGNLIVLSANSGFFKFANSSFLTVPSAVWMTLLVVVVLGLLLSRTVFGRYMVAAGGNAEAARLAGVRVNAIRVLTFTLSGGAAGLGGVIDISRLLSAQAASGGSALSFTVLAGIVVGGTSIAGGEGSVWRTGIGVLFIALIGNGFNLLGVDPLYQQIVLGLILLLAVGLDSWARSRRR